MSITCKICGVEFPKIIPWQHLQKHEVSTAEYKKLHGDVYSSDTLAALSARVPHNKGKKITDPAALLRIQEMVALREGKFRNGDIKRGTKKTDEQKQIHSKKQKEYAAKNPLAMSARAKKAIETKKLNNYDFGSAMRGKTQSEKSRTASSQTIKILNNLKSQKSNIEISNRISLLNLTLQSDIADNVMALHCNTCLTDFKFTKQYFHLAKFKTTMCPTCYPRTVSKQSQGENELFAFIQTMCPDAVQSYRETYHSKELDIYIPSKNIGIEFNGLYWHSESVLTANNKSPTSDFEKFKYFNARGIRLISIFEDEWSSQTAIVKSRLQNLLGKTATKLYARNCTVALIPSKAASAFCNATHIMGAGRSNIRYGLYHNSLLVSVMTFSKNNLSRKITNTWEINRFSSALDMNIVGGASKLFTAFIRDQNPKSIISYADNRWSNGNLYKALGFKQTKTGSPNYWYVQPNIGRIHRFNLRKTVNDDQSLTEYENRLAQGYNRIWDCGSTKWEWQS